ncbi:hypothetical protein F5144DRAFT_566846 [Chaetomium tenue]|uniref:Uncharacterized protein n=1 Tax=Chaetomium tenue TaxID=1854479 RepID=A0ACB7PD61_9PEZI|nr:hypothetical protein F5144DRAFT_566846 [Chaetomium globosum]
MHSTSWGTYLAFVWFLLPRVDGLTNIQITYPLYDAFSLSQQVPVKTNPQKQSAQLPIKYSIAGFRTSSLGSEKIPRWFRHSCHLPRNLAGGSERCAWIGNRERCLA